MFVFPEKEITAFSNCNKVKRTKQFMVAKKLNRIVRE